MAISGLVALVAGGWDHRERTDETNLMEATGRRTGKAAGRGGAVKSRQRYDQIHLFISQRGSLFTKKKLL